jgi:hypothetical protein
MDTNYEHRETIEDHAGTLRRGCRRSRLRNGFVDCGVDRLDQVMSTCVELVDLALRIGDRRVVAVGATSTVLETPLREVRLVEITERPEKSLRASPITIARASSVLGQNFADGRKTLVRNWSCGQARERSTPR